MYAGTGLSGCFRHEHGKELQVKRSWQQGFGQELVDNYVGTTCSTQRALGSPVSLERQDEPSSFPGRRSQRILRVMSMLLLRASADPPYIDCGMWGLPTEGWSRWLSLHARNTDQHWLPAAHRIQGGRGREGAKARERLRESEGERGRERREDERSTERRRTNLSCLQSKLTFARV